jgi:NMD protein affecting ribosome stability and mRNA decay
VAAHILFGRDAMSFLKCSYCGNRCVDGVHHTYWFIPSRHADAFRVRQRLCSTCLAVNVDALLTPPDAETLTCSACGISVEDEVFPVYVTWYDGDKIAHRGAMALCEQHQLELKVRADMNALDLPDRYVEEVDRAVTAPLSATAIIHSVGRADPGRKHGHR